MIMEKALVLGGSGLLGGHLIEHLKSDFHVVATYKRHPIEMEGCRSIYLDITEAQKTMDVFTKEGPDLVILTSAHTNVDYCEKNPDEAGKLNSEGARNVALASKKAQAKLIYLSTDLVFDGSKTSYTEGDVTNPVNHYGRTKLEGEHEVMALCEDAAVARVSVLYGWNIFDHTFNFVAWVHDNLMKGKELKLFTDQYRNATFVKNACQAILNIHKKGEKGVFHVVGKNCVNRHDIGMQVAGTFGLDESLIKSCSSDESDWHAKRPKRCCLTPDKMEKKLGVKSMSIEEGLLTMRGEEYAL
jgi:dTDP-4-dehydrorhamnose reductase